MSKLPNTGAIKVPSRKRKKQSKKYSLTFAVAFILVIAVCAALFFVTAGENKAPAESTSPSDSASGTQTDVPTQKPAEMPETSTAPTATQQAPSGSLYGSVTYRSPTAVPADIFKHGRDLMLLNNDYEIPEDFQWDLVYWSNGQTADPFTVDTKTVVTVDRAAYEPLKAMFKAASDAGLPLQLVSGYRSFQHQDRNFTNAVNSYLSKGYSKEEAIKLANQPYTFPGTSEHNTGYGFDILQNGQWYLTETFENTAECKWLNEHAEEYGFILRYPKDKTDITGIMYEPWHFRYVGVEHAKKINELGFCLEEYIEYLES